MKNFTFTSTIFFAVLLTAVFNHQAKAQVPQAFKYQSIVRNAGREILPNQAVSLRLSILQGSETGTAVYTETWNKTTNDFGLIVLNVGEGTSSDNFSAIAWGEDVYYLKAEIDPAGGTNYTDAGTSQLLSVPYALYAGSSANSAESPWQQNGSSIYYNAGNVGIGTNTPNKKLVIKATSNNDTLMEILDKDGNPLMVITPQLTKFNIIPENASAAGASGGFAVGRYALAKDGKATEDNNLFVVTPDSTRVYTIQEMAGAAGTSGGFAVGRYTTAKGDTTYNFFTDVDSTKVIIPKDSSGIQGGFAVLGSTQEGNEENIFDVGTGVIESIVDENRMLWYPQKNAFMAGFLNVSSADAVGENSLTVGNNCTASGNYASAMGDKTRAIGQSSTAMGRQTSANGFASTAMGYLTKASNNFCTAIGYSTEANGINSTAMGNSTTADGENSTAMGLGTTASGISSTAMGTGTIASGENSTAMGCRIEAKGDYSFGISLNSIPGILPQIEQANTMAIVGGNVGVGTVSPDKTFVVDGDARVTGDIFYGTSGSNIYNKPDFVFEKDYPKQYDILETEQFIIKNKHLPWLTSAKAEKDGLNLTRMNFETLEAVENQQLQIITLKKENESQEKQIKSQNQKIERQNKKIEKQAGEIEKLKQEKQNNQALRNEVQSLKKEIEALKRLIQK